MPSFKIYFIVFLTSVFLLLPETVIYEYNSLNQIHPPISSMPMPPVCLTTIFSLTFTCSLFKPIDPLPVVCSTWCIYWSMGSLSWVASMNKIDHPYSSSHPLTIASKLGEGGFIIPSLIHTSPSRP